MMDDNDRLLAGALPDDERIGAADMRGDWMPPDVDRGKPPPFPVETFPDWVGDYVCEVAHAIQVPIDLPAMLALAVTAAACAKRARV